jgi:ketosteroid isomerase-like protein
VGDVQKGSTAVYRRYFKMRILTVSIVLLIIIFETICFAGFKASYVFQQGQSKELIFKQTINILRRYGYSIHSSNSEEGKIETDFILIDRQGPADFHVRYSILVSEKPNGTGIDVTAEVDWYEGGKESIPRVEKKNAWWLIKALIKTGGSVPSLEARPVSPDEKAIKVMLKGYEKAWNKKDVDGVMAFYHQKAIIMTGKDRDIVSRKHYRKILPDKLITAKSLYFGVSRMKIVGDKAKVKIKMRMTGHGNTIVVTYSMVRQNGKWLIVKQGY